MIDIKLIRTNPELVKENIKKKFQDDKLPLVDKNGKHAEAPRSSRKEKREKDEWVSRKQKKKVSGEEIGGTCIRYEICYCRFIAGNQEDSLAPIRQRFPIWFPKGCVRQQGSIHSTY